MKARKAILVMLGLAVFAHAFPRAGFADGDRTSEAEMRTHPARKAAAAAPAGGHGGGGVAPVGGGGGDAVLGFGLFAAYAVTYPIFKTGELLVDGISSLFSGSTPAPSK
jgi:hypothetical protein